MKNSKHTKFIPFADPDIGDEEIDAVVNVMKSGWLTSGPVVRDFEASFSQFFQCDDLQSIAVNSATAGLHLALEALGVGEGDEVIVPTHTFTASAEIVRYLGADVVLADVHLDTLCIDVEDLKNKISPKTKAIVVVHFAGLSCEMNKILSLAKSLGLYVVEDAAHALPTTYKGEMIGALMSDATVFSFYANKTITTGEGGMLVTRSEKIATRARIMRLHGINRDIYNRFTSNAPGWEYQVVAPGFKYNMTDIAAAIGIEQLKKAKKFQLIRQRIANRYLDGFKDLPVLLPANSVNDIHSWHLFVLRLKEEKKGLRNELINYMFSNGIGCSVHYIPLHLHPYWSNKYGYDNNQFPNSTLAYETSISLPIYTKMNDDEIEKVITCIVDFFKLR